ncbi:hypothetical protein B0J17DRAFT_657383 [Rhizoctonia solani]|nr:hypothetical protein B0J17DRAFT_657383 [Rhizoctonia solani]
MPAPHLVICILPLSAPLVAPEPSNPRIGLPPDSKIIRAWSPRVIRLDVQGFTNPPLCLIIRAAYLSIPCTIRYDTYTLFSD